MDSSPDSVTDCGLEHGTWANVFISGMILKASVMDAQLDTEWLLGLITKE